MKQEEYNFFKYGLDAPKLSYNSKGRVNDSKFIIYHIKYMYMPS